MNPADLSLVDAARLLHQGDLSSSELVAACLQRVVERDGMHTPDGDFASINAWVRVYADDANRDAASADSRLTARAQRQLGAAPPLCGVPIGLKDLYAVAGKPLTASSSLLNEIPDDDSEVWTRLRAAGAVLLGHTHTHEFAAGGTTDQVGNPWALDKSAGGSSGGSAAALAAGMVPASVGTDTAGSLRIPSALCGTSTIKPTRNLVATRGVVPLAPSLDHCGPMARSVRDCTALLQVMAGPDFADATTGFAQLAPGAARVAGTQSLHGVRIAMSQRPQGLDDDIRGGFERAVRDCEQLGATIVEPTADAPADEPFADHGTVLCAEMLDFHRRYNNQREGYRRSTIDFLEAGERRGLLAFDYVALQQRRRHLTNRWWQWFETQQIDALVEPTVPIAGISRGPGYDAWGYDAELVSLTYLWNWVGFPVVSLPAGVGGVTALPVSVSLIGRPATDRALLAIAVELQDALGTWRPSFG